MAASVVCKEVVVTVIVGMEYAATDSVVPNMVGAELHLHIVLPRVAAAGVVGAHSLVTGPYVHQAHNARTDVAVQNTPVTGRPSVRR